jgi:hypothetical protein
VIAGSDYESDTKFFRNSYNHRIPPGIMFGMTRFVSRKAVSGKNGVTYAFGGTEPIDLNLVVDLLRVEQRRCYDAFDGFKKLVRDFEAVIESSHRQS